MNILEIASPPQILAGRKDEKEKLNWQESLPIQRLLDVVSSIIAEEYIVIAKQNRDVFINNTPHAPSGQGDTK